MWLSEEASAGSKPVACPVCVSDTDTEQGAQEAATRPAAPTPLETRRHYGHCGYHLTVVETCGAYIMELAE